MPLTWPIYRMMCWVETDAIPSLPVGLWRRSLRGSQREDRHAPRSCVTKGAANERTTRNLLMCWSGTNLKTQSSYQQSETINIQCSKSQARWLGGSGVVAAVVVLTGHYMNHEASHLINTGYCWLGSRAWRGNVSWTIMEYHTRQ